ncbi:MAG: hypothetical protein O9289_13480 [Rhodobacteraceae bacterium]|nr:hypothetical protein [Paracoccaceae bacterium]MCZ8084209.1 hypothetical protein [Paracoccaceae bacterium]
MLSPMGEKIHPNGITKLTLLVDRPACLRYIWYQSSGEAPMATTEIGKELRRLRIEKDERLLDMAERLDKSSAFISAVETGKKSPPNGFEEIIIRVYRLTSEAADRLRKAADRSRKAFTLEASDDLQRDTFGLMARRMNDLSSEDLQKILTILQSKGDAK